MDVAGDSMLPTLRAGDQLVVDYRATPRPGAIVVTHRPDRHDLVVVKRIRERRAAGWVVVGDNPSESTDSRTFGPVADDLVLGVVVARVWPWPRRFGIPE